MDRGFSVLLLVILLTLAVPIQGVSGQVNSDEGVPVTVHVVQRGETLFRIAQSYGLTVDQIASVNGIANPGNIQVGQRLIIPVDGYELPPPEPIVHIVQVGENLNLIADRYDTTVPAILDLNNLSQANLLFVGQTIAIPAPAATLPDTTIAEPVSNEASAVTEGSGVRHVVQRGETLFSIAQQYGVSLAELEAANDLPNSSLIFAGQELIVPGADQPQRVDFGSPIRLVDILPLILVEGQSGRVRVETIASASVTGTFLERDLNFVPGADGTVHYALLAIPVYTSPGVYPMTLIATAVNGQSASLSLNIQIRSGDYSSQNIDIPEDRMQLLAPAVEDNELGLLRNVTSGFTVERYFQGTMSLPAAAVMNSPFGTRRSYNGGAVDRFHAGADFAGAPGSAVLAAAAGRVVLADTLHIRGISVVIDHGWGVYTNYSHLSERYVHIGDYVSMGQVIGTVGNTGRATGAHLHWELWLNGVPVDPMQWVRENFF